MPAQRLALVTGLSVLPAKCWGNAFKRSRLSVYGGCYYIQKVKQVLVKIVCTNNIHTLLQLIVN
jgi:hypothetical protein